MNELLQRVNRTILTPGLLLLPAALDTPEARVLLLTIGMQESRFRYRWQIVDPKDANVRGPARGFWQFERGGVQGVLEHRRSGPLARQACAARGVMPSVRPLWTMLADDDLLACAIARLALYANPKMLPRVGSGGEAWAYYLDTWRPGKPRASTWNGYYAQAMQEVIGG